MRETEYVSEIRRSEGLCRAVLERIVVDRRRGAVTFCLTTDKTYSPDDAARAAEVSARFVPEGWTAEVKITKFVPDGESVKRAIFGRIAAYSPACAAFLSEDDIRVEMDGSGARFCLQLSEEEQKFLPVKEILDGVSADLCRTMCGSYTGAVESKEKQIVLEPRVRTEQETDAPPPPRYFSIGGYEPIDGGEKPSRAKYIDDCGGAEDDLTVCGAIVYMQERQTSKGKPMFRIRLSDGSGSMSVTYFSKQATVEKIRALKEGDWIVCSGANEFFNENLTFHAKRVNRGRAPEDFVPEPRPTRKAPAQYRTVFPEAFEDYRQTGLFTQSEPPAALKGKEFVVFDLETTGLNNTGTGGVMDCIIEIGAVRISDGVIREKFSSFVAYDKKLPQNIVDLTGITDDMLVGAPTIDKVVPDFYKFCDGCFLVGHNVTFDYRFVEYYAEKQRFSFTQKRFDTLTIAQSALRLPNYKLNTIADYFGVTFNHHRAFDDALATAKIFIELIRMKKSLPAEGA